MNFAESQGARAGVLGESLIAQYFIDQGWTILPAYEKEIDTGKGPRVFAPSGQWIAPDLVMFRANSVVWVEAKHKSRFSWYGIGGHWVTGIDRHHFDHYCQIAEETSWPVWLLFFHREAEAWDKDIERWSCPSQCPTGLFGGSVNELRINISHESEKHGRTGMVYWNPETHLRKIATLEDVMRASLNRQIGSKSKVARYSAAKVIQSQS